MKNNNSSFKKYGAPVVVLVVICLVVTIALAATNAKAQPIIDARAEADASAARIELLPDAGEFTEYDGNLIKTDDKKVEITDCYVSDAGAVMTVNTQSFGGTLTEMVGIDADGKITGVKILDASDTPGVGSKAQEPSHLKQYKGLDEIASPSAKADENVDHITGATVSSDAIHYGVYCAMEQYDEMGGAK